MARNIVKLVVLFVAVGLYFRLSSGLPSFDAARAAARRGESAAMSLYIGGAILALWGRAEVGALKPVSLRGMFILLGAMLMTLALVLVRALRESV